MDLLILWLKLMAHLFIKLFVQIICFWRMLLLHLKSYILGLRRYILNLSYPFNQVLCRLYVQSLSTKQFFNQVLHKIVVLQQIMNPVELSNWIRMPYHYKHSQFLLIAISKQLIYPFLRLELKQYTSKYWAVNQWYHGLMEIQ